jgi:hypothetical protein
MMRLMRTTLNLDDDALIAAQSLARRRKMSLGEAVSELVRKGAAVGSQASLAAISTPLRGRFALLPQRDEVITADHIRDLMEREGV